TTYDKNGQAIAFGTLTNEMRASKILTSTTQGEISATKGGQKLLSFGMSCRLAKINSCGFGGIASVGPLNQSIGVSSEITNFVWEGSSNNGIIAMSAYTGALGALTLHKGSGDSWRIGGGTKVASLKGGFFETVDIEVLNVHGGLTLKDARADAAGSTGFDTRLGMMGGRVTQLSTRKTFAKFSTDATGSGSIDYSDASTGKIALFIILS
ncbi:MAG TPA: hypothetical protein VFE36_13205, partial [Candidatus Baltobacteraceae bacterium]|nr:hypothetical protein [Candidatus Baltobacteraceae bacterium]